MPGVLIPEHRGRGTSTQHELDTLPIARNFSKIIKPPPESSLDVDMLGFAKEFPHLINSEAYDLFPTPSKVVPPRRSNGNDCRPPMRMETHEPTETYELVETHKPKVEVRIRDFALHSLPALPATPTSDPLGHKININEANVSTLATKSNSTSTASLDGSKVIEDGGRRTGMFETGENVTVSGMDQSREIPHNSSAVTTRKESSEPVANSPVRELNASTTEEILLSSAPPFDHQTMKPVPTSINNSGRPSPPPTKPLPPLPATHGSPKTDVDANRGSAPKPPVSDHIREPPIPPKSPARSKRNSLHIPNNEHVVPPVPIIALDIKALNPLLLKAATMDDALVPRDQSPEQYQTTSVHEESFDWQQSRKQKVQALKKRHLEASRSQNEDQKDVIPDHTSDSPPDSDDTIILPKVTLPKRKLHGMASPRPQSTHSDRWSHLKEAAYGKTPESTTALPDPALQPAPLRPSATVHSSPSKTRPQYKHKTQGSLYIPPSPPLSPTSSASDKETAHRTISNRTSFHRHRSCRRFSTVIEPTTADTEIDTLHLSSSGDEGASQLEAALAAEKKRNALLEAALLAMAEAMTSVAASGRPSPTREKSGGQKPLESALEAMISSFGGGKR